MTDSEYLEGAFSAERTYNLGQYQSLKLFTSISKIPDKIVLNPPLVAKLRKLQFIELELGYRIYGLLAKEMAKYNLEDSIVVLEEMRTNLLDDIYSTLTITVENTEGDN